MRSSIAGDEIHLRPASPRPRPLRLCEQIHNVCVASSHDMGRTLTHTGRPKPGRAPDDQRSWPRPCPAEDHHSTPNYAAKGSARQPFPPPQPDPQRQPVRYRTRRGWEAPVAPHPTALNLARSRGQWGASHAPSDGAGLGSQRGVSTETITSQCVSVILTSSPRTGGTAGDEIPRRPAR